MNNTISNVQTLKSLPEGTTEEFESVFIFKKAASKTARTGSEFLMVELGDTSGSFAVTCFLDTPAFTFFKNTKEGAIVRIFGLTGHYQGRFSPRINQAEEIAEEEAVRSGLIGSLVEKSPEDADALWAELQGYINSIGHEGLRATTQQVINEIADDFKTCPAAISMHHAYCHGLLEHTVHVTRAGRALLPLYTEVDADLATAGMIVHDTGKVIEYQGYRSIKRTRTGLLQGHVVLGYRQVRKAGIQNGLDANLLERLEHIVLSHQGELEWGAAAMAATPEAVFVSMVDNLDARMGMVQQVLRQANSDEEFSNYMPGLKASVLTTPLS